MRDFLQVMAAFAVICLLVMIFGDWGYALSVALLLGWTGYAAGKWLKKNLPDLKLQMRTMRGNLPEK